VISVPEQTGGRDYADVTAATRELADIYGLRVIIDGSPNSIPPDLKNTFRQHVVNIEPMPRGDLENIPEFRDLQSFLKKHHLDDGVWEIFGGTPVHYIQLATKCAEFASFQEDVIVDEIKRYAHRQLLDALNEKIAESSPNTKAIVKIFREKKTTKVPLTALEAQGLLLDYPNKVFRKVMEDDGVFIVPSTPAVSLIISKNITNDVEVKHLWIKVFSKA
jgi:hypothetical protein